MKKRIKIPSQKSRLFKTLLKNNLRLNTFILNSFIFRKLPDIPDHIFDMSGSWKKIGRPIRKPMDPGWKLDRNIQNFIVCSVSAIKKIKIKSKICGRRFDLFQQGLGKYLWLGIDLVKRLLKQETSDSFKNF